MPQVLGGVPEREWCTCEPRHRVNGVEYPPAAAFEIPGWSWISGMFGGGKSKGGPNKEDL